ncbi:unnamed protein product [Rangifer tarandus platyrhynchus]|uniref:Uncharacterized protein n=3 Tax=Rangifer tarandus platyrhynchus TaxID=3082113 RepID=A0ACB0FIR4_RANTA|nr:unnamed protein product [Rangifer tarandus platyrhynchus]
MRKLNLRETAWPTPTQLEGGRVSSNPDLPERARGAGGRGTISVNNPRILVGAEESHVEPDGGTKNEERRDYSGLWFLRKSLRGPQHPTSLAQNQ